MRHPILIVCLFLSATSSVYSRQPNENPKNYAVTDIDEVDEDFAFQGEYTGTIAGRKTGLQVIARGNGKFEARELSGGLPGAGWNGQHQQRMTGERSGESLVLAGKTAETNVTYEIDGQNVRVTGSDGQSLGTLKKVLRKSPTLGLAPPWEATRLFDGDDLWQFKNGRITEEGWLEEGTELKHAYHDFLLHVEFRLPYMPYATGQGRANSGCYLQSRYEVQILDSFGLDPEFNHCGALYRLKAPDVNMCLPPLSWQTYEIEFKAARFDSEGQKTRNARITVWHNGVKIHDDFELERKTGAGKQEGPQALVTKFQDHRNPVRFRNMWIIDLNQPIPAPMAHPDFKPWSPEHVLSKK